MGSNLTGIFSYTDGRSIAADTSDSLSFFVERTDLDQDRKLDLILYGFTGPWDTKAVNRPQTGVALHGIDGGYEPFSSFQIPKTVHPRAILYGDFNKDSKIDVFIADHGWDTNPFPGAQNKLVLSSSSGWQDFSINLPQVLDFTHCAAIGDVNRDGNLDIFVGSVDTSGAPQTAYFLMGDGRGGFSQQTATVPQEIRGQTRFYAAQLEDLNGDLYPELIIGNSGDRANITSRSIVFWNEGGTYSTANRTLLPHGYFGSQNEQILDIKAVDLNADGSKELILTSTQNNPYYNGWAVQILTRSGNSFVDISVDSFEAGANTSGAPGVSTSAKWFPFTYLWDVNSDGAYDLIPSALHAGFFLNDGFGHFIKYQASDFGISSQNFQNLVTGGTVGYVNGVLSWSEIFRYQGTIWERTVYGREIPKPIVIRGTSSNDQINGNALDNQIIGLAGNDQINGGAGTDTATFQLARSNYTISLSGTSATVTSRSGSEGVDTLTGIERLSFADGAVALDLSGMSGMAYRIYKAAFNRDPMNGDKGGLGYWIGQMDRGMGLLEVSARFVDSNEFRSLYGTNPTNEQFLNKLYTNVLGRQPEASGYNWWLNQLNTNPEKTKAKVLADFAESPENQTGVLGLIGSGITYEPWVG